MESSGIVDKPFKREQFGNLFSVLTIFGNSARYHTENSHQGAAHNQRSLPPVSTNMSIKCQRMEINPHPRCVNQISHFKFLVSFNLMTLLIVNIIPWKARSYKIVMWQF